MSRMVLKFNLGPVTKNPASADYSLLVPVKSNILGVGLQPGPGRGRDIVMWVEATEGNRHTKLITRYIRRFWTGSPMGVRNAGYKLDYYGTVQDEDSGLVTHIYEEVEP